MDNLLFIINPVAGGGKAKALIPQIEKVMSDNKIKYNIILTSKPGEAIKIAEENSKHHNYVIAVGGDGTVNEVAKGLINSKKGVLGIIPGGTGNDMSKSLGISLNSLEALETIIKGKTKKVDIGMVNNQYFLNIASVGFDAEVVKNVEFIKKRIKGKTAYILGVITTLLSYKKREITLEIDGETFIRKSVLLAVGNGGFYGGGMNILPMAKVNDGFFHICSIKNVSNIKILLLFPSIFKGNHLRYKNYIEIFKSKTLTMKNVGPVIINIDGDLIINDKKDIIFNFDEYKLEVISNES